MIGLERKEFVQVELNAPALSNPLCMLHVTFAHVSEAIRLADASSLHMR